MPELPEVEVIRRTLAPRVTGRTILRVQVRETRLRETLAPGFARALRGRKITGVSRAGKYVVFALDNGATWLVHLGMSGQLIAGACRDDRHTHVRVELSGGLYLAYRDPRRFGLMKVTRAASPSELAVLGIDPLSTSFHPEHLRNRCRYRRRLIKNLLMDQRVVAGIGNIYANEILYRAGIRPTRRADRLTRGELTALCRAARAVLRAAISSRGTSIADYRDGSGRRGRFQLHLAVYGRGGQPCRCGRAAVKAVRLAGRGTFYCPACQR